MAIYEVPTENPLPDKNIASLLKATLASKRDVLLGDRAALLEFEKWVAEARAESESTLLRLIAEFADVTDNLDELLLCPVQQEPATLIRSREEIQHRNGVYAVVRKHYSGVNPEKSYTGLETIRFQFKFLSDDAQRNTVWEQIVNGFTQGLETVRIMFWHAALFEQGMHDLIEYYVEKDLPTTTTGGATKITTTSPTADPASIPLEIKFRQQQFKDVVTKTEESVTTAGSDKILDYLRHIFSKDDSIEAFRKLRTKITEISLVDDFTEVGMILRTLKSGGGALISTAQSDSLKKILQSKPLIDEFAAVVRHRCSLLKRCPQLPPVGVEAIPARESKDMNDFSRDFESDIERWEYVFDDELVDAVIHEIQTSHIAAALKSALKGYVSDCWKTYDRHAHVVEMYKKNPSEFEVIKQFDRWIRDEGLLYDRGLQGIPMPAKENDNDNFEDSLFDDNGSDSDSYQHGRHGRLLRHPSYDPRKRMGSKCTLADDHNNCWAKEINKATKVGAQALLNLPDAVGSTSDNAHHGQEFINLLFGAAQYHALVHGSFAATLLIENTSALTIPHTTMFEMLRFFGFSDDVLLYFTNYLQRPVYLQWQGPSETFKMRRGIPSSSWIARIVQQLACFAMDTAVNDASHGTVVVIRRGRQTIFWNRSPRAVAETYELFKQARITLGMPAPDHEAALLIDIRQSIPTEDSEAAASLPETLIPWGFYELHPTEMLCVREDLVKKCEVHLCNLLAELEAQKAPLFEVIRLWNAYHKLVIMPRLKIPVMATWHAHIPRAIEILKRLRVAVENRFGLDNLLTFFERKLHYPDNVNFTLRPGFLLWPVEFGGLGLRLDVLGWCFLNQQTTLVYDTRSMQEDRSVYCSLDSLAKSLYRDGWEQVRWLDRRNFFVPRLAEDDASIKRFLLQYERNLEEVTAKKAGKTINRYADAKELRKFERKVQEGFTKEALIALYQTEYYRDFGESELRDTFDDFVCPHVRTVFSDDVVWKSGHKQWRYGTEVEGEGLLITSMLERALSSMHTGYDKEEETYYHCSHREMHFATDALAPIKLATQLCNAATPTDMMRALGIET